VTADFGKNSAKFVGDTAGKKEKDLNDQAAKAKAAGNSEEAARLTAEASLWSEGGAYRIAMHVVAGAMGGGVNGAAGAGASAASAGVMNQVQEKLTNSLIASGMNKETAAATASLLTAGAAATIASAAGGVQGATTGLNVDMNNRQLHPEEKQRIRSMAGGDHDKERRLTDAACAMVKCSAEFAPGSQEYNVAQNSELRGAGNLQEIRQLSAENRRDPGMFGYTGTDKALDAATSIGNSSLRAGGKALDFGRGVVRGAVGAIKETALIGADLLATSSIAQTQMALETAGQTTSPDDLKYKPLSQTGETVQRDGLGNAIVAIPVDTLRGLSNAAAQAGQGNLEPLG
jgi:filamentous hemagglutinin